MRVPDELPTIAASVLARLRERRPRVHCITNSVAQAYTANALLAVGAVPSMTVAIDEIGEFVAGADALLVNLGTMDPERREAVGIAIKEARGSERPWVLDPVFVERSAPRAAFARSLVANTPAAVRMNAAEFTALAGAAPTEATCRAFAEKWSTVVALTGSDDVVADGARRAVLSNGDPLMAKITAMGCAGSAILAACLAVEPDAFLASVAGLLVVGIAGEMAAAHAAGPGSMSIGVIDALHAIDAGQIAARARTRPS
jgi:hydroxyethylthiazole kinase